jgi:Putative metallopeptidase
MRKVRHDIMRKDFRQNSIRTNLINLISIGLLLLIVFGCVCPNSKDDDRRDLKNTDVPTPTKNDGKKNDSDKSNVSDKGDFLVERVPVKDSRYAEIDRRLKEERTMEKAADKLNKALALPHDITMMTRDCNGTINAFYNPDNRSITVCYELMEYFYKLYKDSGRSESEAYADMEDATTFFFLHELGHALIDAYQLPVTGKEEDSADSLSSYVCLNELGDDGADGFQLKAKQSNSDKLPFYDEHSLDQQRFYNLLCFLYGSNESKYHNVVDKDLLPRERGVRCPIEFQKMSKSWELQLKPYRK